MIDILIQKPLTSSFSAGVLGEHNFRQLKIELTTELQGADSYILEFEQNGKAVVSDELSEIEGYVYYPISQDVSTLSDKYVNVTLTGYFGDNIGKSLKFSLRFENAVNIDGADIIDGVEKGIVEQAFEIADKFNEDSEGRPTYNGTLLSSLGVVYYDIALDNLTAFTAEMLYNAIEAGKTLRVVSGTDYGEIINTRLSNYASQGSIELDVYGEGKLQTLRFDAVGGAVIKTIDIDLIDLSNYLSKTNTAAYTPTADYNPATKGYVDDKAEEIRADISTGDSNSNAYTDTKAAEAKAYTDTKAEEIRADISTGDSNSNAYTDTKAAEAKAYTDTKAEEIRAEIPTVLPSPPRTVATFADLPFIPNTGEEMYYVLGDSEEVVGTKVSPDFTGVDSAFLFFDKLMIKESPEAPTISPTELDDSYVSIYVYDENGLQVNTYVVSLECYDGINFVLSVNESYFMYAWNNFSFNDEGTTYNIAQGWNKFDESQNVAIPCNFSEVLNTFDFVAVNGGINYNHVSPFFDTYDIPCIKHPEGLYAYNHETWNQVSFGKTKVVDHFDGGLVELVPVDNALYNFGSLYSLYIHAINDGVNLFHITFSTAITCNVALPANVVWAGEAPDFAANSLCEISFARIKTADGYKFVARGSAVEVTA